MGQVSRCVGLGITSLRRPVDEGAKGADAADSNGAAELTAPSDAEAGFPQVLPPS